MVTCLESIIFLDVSFPDRLTCQARSKADSMRPASFLPTSLIGGL